MLFSYVSPGLPPQPSIWAVPGAVISTDSDVSIFCRTPPGVTRVHLYYDEPYGKWFDHTPEGAQEVFEFCQQDMTHISAGIYYCEYTKGGQWSQTNDKLQMVVTGEELPKNTVLKHQLLMTSSLNHTCPVTGPAL